MKNLKIMSQIQNCKRREVAMGSYPALDAEGQAIASKKRIAIDQPTSEVKQDPLR